MLRRERACLQKLKKIFSRQNGLVLLLVLVEFVVLALRFVGDFRTGGVIDITPDLIIPYAEECTNDDRAPAWKTLPACLPPPAGSTCRAAATRFASTM